jgi:hypothetical protein
MIRTLILISTVFILCNCASSKPNPGSAQVDSDPGLVQANSSQPDTSPEPANSTGDMEIVEVEENASQPDTSPEPANSAGDMEIVEVEGIKEKQHCTRERRTGTRIANTYCRTYVEDERQRKSSKAWLNTIKAKPQGVTPGQKG